MPVDNFSLYIYACTVSRRSKHKGIAILKIPSDTDFEQNWREKFVSMITKDRVIYVALSDRMNSL